MGPESVYILCSFLSCAYHSLIFCSLVAITPFLFLSAVLLLPHSRLHLSCYSVDSLPFQSSLSFDAFSQLSTVFRPAQISRYAFHSHSLSLFHLPLNYHTIPPKPNQHFNSTLAKQVESRTYEVNLNSLHLQSHPSILLHQVPDPLLSYPSNQLEIPPLTARLTFLLLLEELRSK